MKSLNIVLLGLLLCVSGWTHASSKEEAPQVIYYNLVPSLIGNLTDPGVRLKFFKADVSLRYTGSEADAKVKQHEALIRHQLVLLFSAQSSQSINAPDGREGLRSEALKQVQQALTAEEGQPLVEDLLFNNLIIQ